MLYHIHELQQAATAPMRLFAEAMQTIYSNPFVPAAYTRFGRAIAAGAELVERTTRHYGKPRFGLAETSVDGRTVAVREEILAATPFCTLRRFHRDGCDQRGDPKVLVVAPLSGHHATLLRGTVETLLPDHDVAITDWTDAALVPLSAGGFDLDDYIDTVIAFLGRMGPGTHALAVCQPTVPVLAAASLMAAENDPCRPRSMILIGGPIDTRVNPTKVNELATSHPLDWFECNVVDRVPAGHPGAGRRVYPGFLQLQGFMSMNLERHVGSHLGLLEDVVKGDARAAAQHREFYDEYFAVMDLPAEYYLQTINDVFQQHHLPRGIMVSRGRAVDPSKIIDTALMTVEGEKDDITGIGQTEAAHLLCANLPSDLRRHHLQPKVGHYGLFNGHRWREEIYPHVRDFIRSHGGAPLLANQVADSDEPARVGGAVRRLREMLPA